MSYASRDWTRVWQTVHEDLKQALVSGNVRAKDVEALTQALIENESALRTFAGL